MNKNELIQISLEKSDLLDNIVSNFKAMICEIDNNITDNINKYLMDNQKCYDMIDIIDLQYKAILMTLDTDEVFTLDNLLLRDRIRQSTALLTISTLNDQSIMKIGNVLSETRDQLIKIKRKKNIYNSYPSFI